jgi:hypothetical protein
MTIFTSNTSNISITSSVAFSIANDHYGYIQGTNGVYKYDFSGTQFRDPVFTITLSKNGVNKTYYLHVTGHRVNF